MSARDELFSLACQDMPVTGPEVNEAIDAYAHELAEKIRETAGDPPGYTSKSSKATYRWWAKRMAKVIDPEAS